MNSHPTDPRLKALHDAGIRYKPHGRHRYSVGPGFSYWPSTDRWRSFRGAVSGYGLEPLINAVRERALASGSWGAA